ncbi:LacI family DNA-binding transcriptional regulator [Dactylosporangium matsuzakiense]|uniref:LacI family transcriptional regulator n=2 Tax=Dactylosporangium matsuzakiense TaxID=53360 RepID=A0A9W6KL90_9ACTN|nr:LacI family DNA-binding transcriptional regulator [Dactylosporangium matsuzakiense]GLL02599.1 LacI family transcriptional regulator [Dactylosporangium matsuzakiense]
MRDVAAAAGVSVSTVANVLNNPGVVAVATRERVEAAMNRVGFVRSAAARQLRGLPSRLVGSITLDQGNPFYAELNRGIEDHLDEAGCMLLACSTDQRADRELRALQLLEEHSPRGVIITPTGANGQRLAAVSARGTPVVLLDARQDGADLCAAAVDHVLGGRLAGDHLLALGHRRVAFLTAGDDIAPVRERRAGLAAALEGAGAGPPVEVRAVEAGFSGGTDAAVSKLLAWAPSAVVCVNDIAALAVIRAVQARGLRVPGDLSVVGYDDLPFAAHVRPALTTVARPIRALGRVAAELLLAEGGGGHRHREAMFAPRLVVRATTAPIG